MRTLGARWAQVEAEGLISHPDPRESSTGRTTVDEDSALRQQVLV